MLISITARGYIKRVAAKEYRTQGRGGRGVTGQSLRGEDEVLFMLPARSLDTILFFSDKGKVYSERVYQIPDAGRADKGLPLTNILSIEAGEQITATLPVSSFGDSTFCVMATRSGRIKRVAMSEFAAVRPSGLIATSLDEGDVLGWAMATDGKREIILVTRGGQALRYSESKIRAMGRKGAGVTAIRLKDDDYITSDRCREWRVRFAGGHHQWLWQAHAAEILFGQRARDRWECHHRPRHDGNHRTDRRGPRRPPR